MTPSCFKDLSERIDAFCRSDLYPVVSSEYCNGRDVFDVLCQIAEGGAKIVQIREKHWEKRDIYDLAVRFRPVANHYRMLLIIDDHLDVAMAANADGVHCGQKDLPVSVVRKTASQLLTGCSTHNPEEILQACSDGAGYLNIGPVFATRTKQVSYPPVTLENLEKWKNISTIPFSVMGGIKEHHLPEFCRMGIRHIAMVTEITQAEKITEKVQALRRYIL